MFNSNSFMLGQMRPKKRKTFISVIFFGFISSLFLLSYSVFGNDPIENKTLLQINILFRHGERTPSANYPTDPHISYKWVDGMGALTIKGKQSMFKLGRTLRFKYHDFISEYYSNEQLTVKSSHAPRCQMSAMVLLAGLYPPIGRQIWNPDLLWQPIPVNPIPRNVDNLIAAKAPCAAFMIEKMKSDKEIHSNLTMNDFKIFKYLTDNTGLFINNIEQVETLYSILKIEDENNLNLPEWTKSVFPEPLKTFAGMNLESYTRNSILKKLQGGPLLKEWIRNMEKNDKQILLYSGHDLTIVNLLRTVGFPHMSFLPDYGATFILELHNIHEKKIVKALYYNSSQDMEPLNLNIPNCEPMCPLETFKKLVEQNLPSDWEQECRNGNR